MRIFCKYYSFLLLLLSLTGNAQDKNIRVAHVKLPVHFSKTIPLRDMEPVNAHKKSMGSGEIPEIISDPTNGLGSSDVGDIKDGVLQNFNGNKSINDLIVNAEGIGNLQNKIPPDTEGDVGPNHYLQMINMSLAVYNKEGDLVFGPVANLTIWQNEPEPWSGSSNGDPIVLYDEQADRWLISELSFPGHPYGPYYEKIAISLTGDPTGPWYLYGYEYEYFCDYPKIGVWHDGYYMTTNNNWWDGTWHFHAVGVSVFERDSMLIGSSEARRIFYDFYPVQEPWSVLPADFDGNPPLENEPAYLAYYKEAFPDRIMLYSVMTDWGDPASSSIELIETLYPESFSGSLPEGIPQPEGAPYLSSMSNRLLYRLQYRNFGSYQTMVTNHTVNTGNDIAGIRWYEFRNFGFGWNIHQQGTYSPDNTHRWMGSIAMDCYGNIALGYSVSSNVIYPSIRVTGRFKDDPPGIMTIAEKEIIAGSGVQLSPYHRWGDYSCMSVDPSSPTTFWYTQEYYQVSGDKTWQTRIAAFKLYENVTLDVAAQYDTLCLGDNVQLFAFPDGGDGSYLFSWTSIPPGYSSSLQNPSVVPDQTTTYICIADDGYTSDNDSIEIAVIPGVIVNAGKDTLICATQSYWNEDASALNFTSLSWFSSGDGSFSDTTLLNTLYTPGENDILNGEVELWLKAYPINPCDAMSDTFLLAIDPCTGIGLPVAPEVFVRPNPSDGAFDVVIKNSPKEKLLILIRDLKGQIIIKKYIKSQKDVNLIIHIDDIFPGVYIIDLISLNFGTTIKIIVL